MLKVVIKCSSPNDKKSKIRCVQAVGPQKFDIGDELELEIEPWPISPLGPVVLLSSLETEKAAPPSVQSKLLSILVIIDIFSLNFWLIHHSSIVAVVVVLIHHSTIVAVVVVLIAFIATLINIFIMNNGTIIFAV